MQPVPLCRACLLPTRFVTSSSDQGVTGALCKWGKVGVCQCPSLVFGQGVLKGLDFFLLRTTLWDRPKGPSTANHQPPTANRRQPPAATNRQAPTTAKRHQPLIPNHQQPPTTTNRHQLPVANRTGLLQRLFHKN